MMQSGPVNMISSAEAKQFIAEHSSALKSFNMRLEQAPGLVLSNDIYSTLNIPGFPQSAMDGYAIAFADVGMPLKLGGELAAGASSNTIIETGSAVRIFTGAIVPAGADTVVMQEKTNIVNGFLHITDDALKKGDNVRLPGTEIAEGALALPAGTLLTPAAIGFLAGMGVESVDVIPNPRVSIIVTGNELQNPGTPPEPGKVYESNSVALLAALKQLHITDIKVYKSGDDIIQLTALLNDALLKSDLVLMTGGVSVGDYDFTVKVSENCGVQKIFHKIKQRPGKPLFFGKKDKILFFGLPGNPASVLTCFYEYVVPALEKLTKKTLQSKIVNVPISSAYKKPAGFTHFLKANYDGTQANLLQGQESYKMNSFALSNCLVMIPDDVTELAAGEKVEIHVLHN